LARHYPALEVRWREPPSAELIEHLLAVLDDERPSAVDAREDGPTVYFTSVQARDRAVALARAFAPNARVTPLSVPDDAWAERSQASIGPMRVGRVVLTPPWAASDIPRPADVRPPGPDIVITIVPSMGFGTGHHASTRLCLRLLQDADVAGHSVLDAGTGSGALALAAWRLGAARVVAVDCDRDALQSARENVAINGAERSIDLLELDLATGDTPSTGHFEVITANLTGALLRRFAPAFAPWLEPGGTLIASGLQSDEERGVAEAFEAAGFRHEARLEDEGWIGLRYRRAD
jgi:ribosomal protein L11 methyltransferase